VNAWLKLGRRQFYQTAAARPFLDAKLAAHAILTDAGALKATSGPENATITITLDNKMGQCTRLFAVPPLGEIAQLMGDAEEQFEGTVMQVDLSCGGLQSDGAVVTLLTDKLPLRQNLAWGSFANAVASDSAVYLPHRYGVCGGACVQYNVQRTQFVWADHAVEGIDAVLVNGARGAGLAAWDNTVDVTGHAVALITMQQPVDATSTVIARGRGKPHPRTGARMTDPAAIIWDMLANIAGRDVAESQLQEFSAACAARGLEAAGSIESARLSADRRCNAICSSMGALFSAGARGLATLWPGADTGPALYTVAAKPGITATASCKLDDISNDLTVRYAFEAGSPRGSLQLEAPRSVAQYGRRTKQLDAPWCANARTAFDVGSRLLKQSAGRSGTCTPTA
jgi:hypothetical protein